MADVQPISNPAEEWRPVVGYEGLYEVSSHGRVKSLPRVVPHRRHGTHSVRGRILSASAQKSGHINVDLWKGNRQKRVRVHRLVLEAFVGPCPEGMECCHWDDDPANNHISNLRWDTSSANKQDIIRNGNNHELRKTHCKRGHLLQLPNLIPKSLEKGSRLCLACHRARCYVRYHSPLKTHLQEVSDDYYRKIMRPSVEAA